MSTRTSAVGISRRTMMQAAEWVGWAGLAGIVAWWAWRTFHDGLSLDFGLAYHAGQVAWTDGHPERVVSWDGMPFLAGGLAVVSRVVGNGTATDVFDALNLAVVLIVVGTALQRLRRVLSPTWWWIVAVGLLSFGPLLSSMWWKQFNILALGLALWSFELVRRDRPQLGGAILGLSISIKPLAVLLPFVLLARKETRKPGAIALAWVVVLNMAAQALMAARAGTFAALSPYLALKNFADKAQPANIWACHNENFAPGSLLCRLVGNHNWTLQHLVVLGAVALLATWIVEALRGYQAKSWEVLAFTLPLSVMISPLAWSHYQIMLAPLFVLLVVRFTREGAGIGSWSGLATAFLLASLMWQPYGTSIGALRHIVSGSGETQQTLFSVEDVAQFAQYVLVITGVLWYAGHRRAEQFR